MIAWLLLVTDMNFVVFLVIFSEKLAENVSESCP